MQTMKSNFLIRGNPLRHGGRTRRATSPYYGEAALRTSPLERAYKNRAAHYGQAVLSGYPSRTAGRSFSPVKSKLFKPKSLNFLFSAKCAEHP